MPYMFPVLPLVMPAPSPIRPGAASRCGRRAAANPPGAVHRARGGAERGRATPPSPGSRIGSLKATSTVYASGSRPSSAARQRALLHMPCAIGRREAEQPRPEPGGVDRVVVAGDPRRTPCRPAAPPASGRWRPAPRARSPGSRAARPALPTPAQVRRDVAPHLLPVDRRRRAPRRTAGPARAGAGPCAYAGEVERLAGVDRPVHGDPVADVHQPDQREREVRRGHQPQRQRERPCTCGYVAGSVSREPEPADPVVRRPGAPGRRSRRRPSTRPAAGRRRAGRRRRRAAAPRGPPVAAPRSPASAGSSTAARLPDPVAAITPPAGSGRRPGPRCR